MTAIVLPLLPDRTIDPWGGFNPFEVWFFTVLTAAISYLGYIAVRVLGTARGLLVSALAGAVISSTAVTVAFARTAKAGGGKVWPLAGAASLAAMVSILRVGIVVLIIEPRALMSIAPGAFAAAAVFGGCGLAFLSRDGGSDESAPARNPFELGPLFLFAVLFASVATASAVLNSYLGAGSLFAVSALSGAFDVDVAVLSALRLAKQAIPIDVVGQAVLAALAANAVGRLSLAVAAGPAAFWLPLAVTTAAALGVGYAAFALIPGL
jgi:uncharacterized membrane protein (DUF4010 family)